VSPRDAGRGGAVGRVQLAPDSPAGSLARGAPSVSYLRRDWHSLAAALSPPDGRGPQSGSVSARQACQGESPRARDLTKLTPNNPKLGHINAHTHKHTKLATTFSSRIALLTMAESNECSSLIQMGECLSGPDWPADPGGSRARATVLRQPLACRPAHLCTTDRL
jgi:hypothetical protein